MRFARSHRLLFLEVKFGLLGFQLRHQFLDPINRELISNRGSYPLVMLDLSVELHTLFTHAKPRIRALAVQIGCCL